MAVTGADMEHLLPARVIGFDSSYGYAMLIKYYKVQSKKWREFGAFVFVISSCAAP